MTQSPHAATCKGVKVPLSPFLTETRIQRIQQAIYEGDEIAGALSVTGETDRVLEMGAGLGVVGAVTALNAKPEAILSFEANPNLIPHIRALYQLNELEERITVRNQLLIASPDRPETMTFHLGNSFLGSSLIDRPDRPTTPVDVPTVAFDDIRKGFRPTVLIMDIEGGELDFLQHADLTGIRAVVIEFHPKVYGVEGMRICKAALKSAGFDKVAAMSSRLVWTCVRPSGEFTKPDPRKGWSREIVTLKNAIVVPPAERSHVQTTGVLTHDGVPVEHAALWRKHRLLTLPPEKPAGKLQRLEGKWLWGGVLWRYFPHFITESVTRVWALEQIDQSDFDGILFVPKNPKTDDALQKFQQGFYALMGCDLPMVEAMGPLQADTLVVPGQGFGLGPISHGTPEFRDAITRRFAADIAPEGPEKLYISRSKLGPNRGALLGEAYIDAYLEAEGYEVFHPQDHSLEVQIARYRAAKQVIAAEGSSLHLYAFCGQLDAKLAMLLRRKSGATQHISTHVQSFTGVNPIWVNHLRRSWKPKETHRKRLYIGEPDFAAIQSTLRQEGFIATNGPAWTQPPAKALQASLGPNFELAG